MGSITPTHLKVVVTSHSLSLETTLKAHVNQPEDAFWFQRTVYQGWWFTTEKALGLQVAASTVFQARCKNPEVLYRYGHEISPATLPGVPKGNLSLNSAWIKVPPFTAPAFSSCRGGILISSLHLMWNGCTLHPRSGCILPKGKVNPSVEYL